MAYLGNDLKVAYPSYLNIDDISGSFNGVTTSFALLVGGVAPSPLPLNSQQCLISVGGVVQRPDDTGAEGFRLSGGNIVFSSAPGTGEDFFGVILAGADYVNAGANFPSGSAGVPSITFDSDLDTGIYNSAANQVGVTCAGSSVSVFSSAGQSFLAGSAGAPSLYPTGDTNTGFWSPAADTIAISTGGSERSRVDSSGRLLVGTSSARDKLYNTTVSIVPVQQIETAGSATPTRVLIASNSGTDAGASGSALILGRSTGTTVGSYSAVSTTYNHLGVVSFQGADGTELVEAAKIEAFVDSGTVSGTSMPGRLVFSTTADGASSPTERMRIGSNGIVYSSQFWVSKSSIGGAGGVYAYDAGADRLVMGNNSGGSSAGVALAPAATSWSVYSDERLKTNLVPIDNGLDKVGTLRAVTGRYKTDDEGTSRSFLIAQDVQAVLPEAVSADSTDDAYLDLRYTEVIPLLVAALKESKDRIETLEAKVAALEAA